ncbi:MAG: hypothetical protein AAB355_02910 [Patescibacteria group bacterium]
MSLRFWKLIAVIIIILLALAAAVFFYPKKAETPSVAKDDISGNIKAPVFSSGISFGPSISNDIKTIISRNVSNLLLSIERSPKDSGLLIDLSMQYKVAGDYGKSLQALEYAAALSPDNYVIFHNMGDIYHYHLKDYKKAESNYLESIYLKPNVPNSHRSLYELYKFFYTEKSSEIPKILKNAITSNPKNYDFVIILAQYYRDSGDKAQAIIYYDKALAEILKTGDEALEESVAAERRAIMQ